MVGGMRVGGITQAKPNQEKEATPIDKDSADVSEEEKM